MTEISYKKLKEDKSLEIVEERSEVRREKG